jgi:phosphoribosylamine--glycine ligase
VGTALEAKIHNIPLTEIADLITFARTNAIDFTVVGPEAPLANGIVDQFRAADLKIWGPSQYCAQLESSKTFAKNFMAKYNIPTASYVTFNDGEAAKAYLRKQPLPIVIKADGLAAGKGVLVATQLDEALVFIDDIFAHHKFGAAGNQVVIEEFLAGTEASFIVMIDGKHILTMATSQDHKRLLDDDLGPNTGGMGAYSPAPIITPELHQRVIREIIQPVIDGMADLGHEYTGFLYAGLMIDQQGNPKTLEFNCRFGDPETQPIMLRLKSDFASLIQLGLAQQLDQAQAKWEDQFAIGVVLASHGYPNTPRKNDRIYGLEKVAQLPDIKIFHAGTKLTNEGLATDGGRVLCVVAVAKDINQAQEKVYQAIANINYAGMQYRKDIAHKAITTE